MCKFKLLSINFQSAHNWTRDNQSGNFEMTSDSKKTAEDISTAALILLSLESFVQKNTDGKGSKHRTKNQELRTTYPSLTATSFFAPLSSQYQSEFLICRFEFFLSLKDSIQE